MGKMPEAQNFLIPPRTTPSSAKLLSDPLAAKRDIAVTILVRCMCVRVCVRACVRACVSPDLSEP